LDDVAGGGAGKTQHLLHEFLKSSALLLDEHAVAFDGGWIRRQLAA